MQCSWRGTLLPVIGAAPLPFWPNVTGSAKSKKLEPARDADGPEKVSVYLIVDHVLRRSARNEGGRLKPSGRDW